MLTLLHGRSEERRVGKVTGVQTCALPIYVVAAFTEGDVDDVRDGATGVADDTAGRLRHRRRRERLASPRRHHAPSLVESSLRQYATFLAWSSCSHFFMADRKSVV